MKLNDISNDFTKFFDDVDKIDQRTNPEAFAYKQATADYYKAFFDPASTPVFDEVNNIPTSSKQWSNEPNSQKQMPSAGSRGLEDIRRRNDHMR